MPPEFPQPTQDQPNASVDMSVTDKGTSTQDALGITPSSLPRELGRPRPDRVRVVFSGPLACFSRPELRVERVSYEVPTPSALRGMMEGIFWKPQFQWIIHEIHVLSPIEFISFRRNELSARTSSSKVRQWMKDPSKVEVLQAGGGAKHATPRTTMSLRDVSYLVVAEPRLYEPWGENTPRKYVESFERRLKKGQCFYQPSFGCREFVADFYPPTGSERPIQESRNLGRMLYDIRRPEGSDRHEAIFFKAVMKSGIIHTTPDDPGILPEGVATLWPGADNAA